MAIPTQSLTSLTVSNPTNGTGSVDLSAYSAERRRMRITAVVTGGTATFTLRGGQSSSHTGVITSSSGVGTTGATLYDEHGPWPAMTIDWASNTGTVAIQAQAWDSL